MKPCSTHGLPHCESCAGQRKLQRQELRNASLDERCAELRSRMERQRSLTTAIRLMAGRGFTENRIARALGIHHDVVHHSLLRDWKLRERGADAQIRKGNINRNDERNREA